MKSIVTIGGGSGSFNVLKGLKYYPVDITAIVTTFDNGGSTGILRDEFGTLPSGDIRRCLVALAPDSGTTDLRDLFNFRFEKNSSLRGHSFGNLFLQALAAVSGSEVGAIKSASEMLNINGTVLPVSLDDAHVCALLENGQIIKGETNIDIPKHDGKLRIKKIYLEPQPTIYKEAYSALINADLIVIGPGDLYTSIMPNILVKGFTEALKKSKSKTVYITNVMTKWGETNGFAASNFASEILRHIGRKKFDYIICNSSPIKSALIRKYEKEKAEPVINDLAKLKKFGGKIILEDIVNQSDIIRHDAKKLASILVKLD